MWKRIGEWAIFIASIIATVVVVTVVMILIKIPRAHADGVDALRAQGPIAYCANWTNIAGAANRPGAMRRHFIPRHPVGIGAQEAQATGRRSYDPVLEKKLLDREQLDAILRPEALMRPQVLPTRE